MELYSALALKIRTGHLAITDADQLPARFLTDVASGAIEVVAIQGLHYLIAENLLVQFGNKTGLRSLDAIQLAVALETHRHASLDAFMVSDLTLAQVAKAQGLAILIPEIP